MPPILEGLSQLTVALLGVGAVLAGLLLWVAGSVLDCVREMTLNSRWQVPVDGRAVHRYVGIAVVANLVVYLGIFAVVVGLGLAVLVLRSGT